MRNFHKKKKILLTRLIMLRSQTISKKIERKKKLSGDYEKQNKKL